MHARHRLTPPNLATLHTKPTWHNRAGRVDRSACFTLTAAQLWRHIPADDWSYRLGLRPDARGLYTHGHQAPRPKPHHFGQCDRYATLTLYARDLWQLHKHEPPYPLQGDFRSAKTNALRHTPRPRDQPGDRPRAQAMRHDRTLGHGPTNPNRGVGFNLYKRLGLDCLWQTTLRIERVIQHANLKQHFLVCPTCSSKSGADIPVCQSAKPNRFAAAGQRTGVVPADAHHHDSTPACYAAATQRCTKLYLPLCTEREYEDAQLAELWLKTNQPPNRPLSPTALKLINRYSELFADSGARNLRCRHCLGLRYGEVKDFQDPISKHKRTGMRVSLPTQPPRPNTQHPKQSEQALFLQNLPKLLSPVPDASPSPPPQRRRPSKQTIASFSEQSAIINQKSSLNRRPADLPQPLRDELLLLAGQLPAFKKLEHLKRDNLSGDRI